MKVGERKINKCKNKRNKTKQQTFVVYFVLYVSFGESFHQPLNSAHSKWKAVEGAEAPSKSATLTIFPYKNGIWWV